MAYIGVAYTVQGPTWLRHLGIDGLGAGVLRQQARADCLLDPRRRSARHLDVDASAQRRRRRVHRAPVRQHDATETEPPM